MTSIRTCVRKSDEVPRVLPWPDISGLVASTLVMMDIFDVAAFSAGIVIVIAACLVAAFYPARRAAGVEPMVALRIE